MTSEDVKALLSDAFPNAVVRVEGEGAKFDVAIVSSEFSGKRPVPRQQMVYSVLNEYIASGVIHAITMNLKSTEEAA